MIRWMGPCRPIKIHVHSSYTKHVQWLKYAHAPQPLLCLTADWEPWDCIACARSRRSEIHDWVSCTWLLILCGGERLVLRTLVYLTQTTTTTTTNKQSKQKETNPAFTRREDIVQLWSLIFHQNLDGSMFRGKCRLSATTRRSTAGQDPHQPSLPSLSAICCVPTSGFLVDCLQSSKSVKKKPKTTFILAIAKPHRRRL